MEQEVKPNIISRLRKLFSTDVVLRNVGGKQLKLVDINKIQNSGLSNNFNDKYGRLYSGINSVSGNSYYDYNNAYQRNNIYRDYELMDSDALISSALDIMADESTLKNEHDEILDIKSSNEEISKVLHNLFYDILNIEFNLWTWVRTMVKYGDCFLHLKIAEKLGIVNSLYLPPYNVNRIEDKKIGENGEFSVGFEYVENNIETYTSERAKKKEYENYEIAHFRLLSDPNFLPYGKSYIEGIRKNFKILTLLEDAVLIHRIMRSPEKRVFYINVGTIPAHEVTPFMEQVTNRMKKEPYIDPQTGDYNLRYNMMNVNEDFYIPVRPGDNTTRIDTTKGLDYTAMEDVTYFRDKILSGLKIPRAFLALDTQMGGKATLAAEDVRFSRTIERIQKIIISELTKLAVIHLYVQGYNQDDLVNFELKMHSPSIILEQERIELIKSKLDVVTTLKDANLLSSDWVYSKLFGMSEDEYNSEREKIIEDAKRSFRISQIADEGNDPIETGESYGTPHDLATIYKRNSEVGGNGNIPKGYGDDLPLGRPDKKTSTFKTQDSNFGNDPLGNSINKDSVKKLSDNKPKYKTQTFTLESKKPLFKLLDKKYKSKEISFLKEDNIQE